MTNEEPETVVLASLQKIKLIKIPIIFSPLKSETSDSFVNHFDGHFASLKTLDFYFKISISWGKIIRYSGSQNKAHGKRVCYAYVCSMGKGAECLLVDFK